MSNDLVRSSLVAASIAVAVALVMGLILHMGASGTAMFVLIMAAVAFVGHPSDRLGCRALSQRNSSGSSSLS